MVDALAVTLYQVCLIISITYNILHSLTCDYAVFINTADITEISSSSTHVADIVFANAAVLVHIAYNTDIADMIYDKPCNLRAFYILTCDVNDT